MGIPFLDSIEKLVNEHGAAAILKERLELAKDQSSALEKKAEDLPIHVGRLQADLERKRSEKAELSALKEQHCEDILIQRGIEFRQG